MLRAGCRPPGHPLLAVIALLAAVEVASGVIQGYYGPIMVDIAHDLDVRYADLNWLEASQLIFSALVVPPLARLGDLVGHKRVLVIATAVTAAATWGIAFAPSFPLMLVAWTLQGVYVVWLPVEVAVIHRRTAGRADQGRVTRRVAAILVATLELSVIVAAVLAGQLADRVSVTTMLVLPAVVVTLCLPVLALLEEVPGRRGGRFDWGGLGLMTLAVLAVLGGLVLIRVDGLTSVPAWLLILAGAALLVPWWRYESRHADPMVDVRLLAHPAQWSVQATAFLVGMSLLGAQVPLSTYFRSDPAVHGYGFGLTAAEGSARIALYVACLAVGALSLGPVSRVLGARRAMVAGCVVYALGYAAWLPLHASPGAAWGVMAVIGLGTGGLVAAIPAAAAAAAPPGRVGSATGLTNATKTIGGGLASSVFAICLASTGTLRMSGGSLGGYYAVWSICAVSGLLAAVVLAATSGRSSAAVSVEPGDPARSPSG
ncbi:MFS transporter [Nocardioides carbamazepini]|uniref:MFS transporter n=1 Tax=Nocardioides carbamazepini TaxID=2854259 RepID=UPI00214A8B3A|nr:MFS transporter [Nocardioides carbamazepini]MCR1786056.1 MFS transporter [Nocardioides carbamazepini]